MLTISNLSKTYKGGKRAVDNLTLEIQKGDIYGFIGHNGAGKTTTIKCVAGILEFSEGDILIEGKSVKTNPLECKRMIAYIPDNPDLYENMTGIQYLNFIADVFSISANEREKSIKEYADMMELTESLGDLISSYSHGMKQKLAIISALVHNPSLYIMDEPFVGLDPKAAHTLKEVMKEKCRQGSAIFFSTHVLEVAEKLCNKIAIIKDGKLITSGETDSVRGNSSLEQLFLELIDNE
ncbi:ABC transporter ATP-binding protein [Ruminiclostridium cellulolyticum]|uniref:ABC transporter related n=1 Tax=Ruminiclostridium cellulolyticum (strain ATCC 35319 / DSM 5812 / JCM 6584 / H10) TaxID=394503 RepID=B8I502_RUMCH|nr:ABC transporter ATP-binding protein [Ruminiclostridium cellulolyticum]ACL74582.1 ABC transporter related [Ruminiclostridium cellulolyticum H10]